MIEKTFDFSLFTSYDDIYKLYYLYLYPRIP